MKSYRSITKKSGDYDKKYMNIKFDSDDDLPLNRMVEIPRTTIVATAVFHENNNDYPQVF